jgi:hypothetical protein
MQGYRPSMTDHRITLPAKLPRSFFIQWASTANVGPACLFMHDLAKVPHIGEAGATDGSTFLGPNEIRGTPYNEERDNDDPCSFYVGVE